jgi:hypothetical protein
MAVRKTILEDLTVAQLLKKFAFCGIKIFTTRYARLFFYIPGAGTA